MILGLDPGTAATGFGVVELQASQLQAVDFGVIRTPAQLKLHRRLDILFHDMSTILDRYRPAAAAVESLFFNLNAQTAFAVGQARGVVLLACAQASCDLFEYTPQQVKQAVVGYGKADKRQIQEMVRVLLGLDARPRPDDAADALGVALCHAHSLGFLKSVARAAGASGTDGETAS